MTGTADHESRRREYREKAVRNLEFRAAAHLHMDEPRIIAMNGRVAASVWIRLLTAALRGRGFTEAELEELIDTEFVLAGRAGQYAAVETALVAEADDIARARRRADLVARAQGEPALAAVMCAGYTQEAQEASHQQDVTLLHMREKRT